MNTNLKAYGRFDGQGRLVVGSVVYRAKKPAGSWLEIQSQECCNFNDFDPYTFQAAATYAAVKLSIFCNGTQVFQGATNQASADFTALQTLLNTTYPMLGVFTVSNTNEVTWSVSDTMKKSFCPTGILSFTIS